VIERPTNAEDLEWATVYKSMDRILVTRYGRISQTATVPQQCNIFFQDWQIETEHIGDINTLAEAFHTSQAVAVSDGLYMEATGTAAWTIEATTARNCIVGTGYTPDLAMDQSAYQREYFIQYWSLPKPSTLKMEQ